MASNYSEKILQGRLDPVVVVIDGSTPGATSAYDVANAFLAGLGAPKYIEARHNLPQLWAVELSDYPDGGSAWYVSQEAFRRLDARRYS